MKNTESTFQAEKILNLIEVLTFAIRHVEDQHDMKPGISETIELLKTMTEELVSNIDE